MKNNEGLKINRFISVPRFYKNIFSPKVLFFVGGIGILVFILSMWHRYIYIDDAFFGEQAYFLAKDGVVKTPSLINFLGCDIQLFSYHKLNIFIGAGLIKIFGLSVTPLRLCTLIFGCLLFFILWKYFKNNNKKLTSRHYLTAAFFLFFNPLILLYAYTYRPEIWVTFFGFCSFYFIDGYINKEDYISKIIFSGIFAGLAFLTHLNGLIFPVTGVLILLIFRKYKAAIVFSGISMAVCVFYFWDLWQPAHFDTWIFQLKNWPDNNATSYLSAGIWSLIKNITEKLLSEHQRFFWSYKVWGISLFFISTLIFNFKYLLKEYRTLIFYTLILILVLNIAGSQIAERFLIYYFPFMVIIISIGILRVFENGDNRLRAIYMVLFIAQICFFSTMARDIFKHNEDYIAKHEAVFSKIQDKSQLILVPYQFVFNTLDKYKIATFKGFEYYEVEIGRKLTQQELFMRADSLKIGYIVFPMKGLKYENTSIKCIDGKKIEHSDLYKVIYQDNDAMILGSTKVVQF